MPKDFIVDHHYDLRYSDFQDLDDLDWPLQDNPGIKPVHDFDTLDNVERYTILQNAKELLAYLNDTGTKFPYDTYFQGTKALQDAMAYVDSLIHFEI